MFCLLNDRIWKKKHAPRGLVRPYSLKIIVKCVHSYECEYKNFNTIAGDFSHHYRIECLGISILRPILKYICILNIIINSVTTLPH